MNYKAQLLRQNKKLFKTDDLALIWEITNRNSLLTTIKRYIDDGTLHSIRKGLYSVMPPQNLNPYELGTAYVKGFCYVSLQTVLTKQGFINQLPQAITLVGGRSQEFILEETRFICRKMEAKYLHNLTGIKVEDDYPEADLERAIADILYYNPKFHFDRDITQYLPKVKSIQEQVFL